MNAAGLTSQNHINKARKPAARPKSMGSGSPGNTPFRSSILKPKRHPIKMPIIVAKQETGLKLISMCPESME